MSYTNLVFNIAAPSEQGSGGLGMDVRDLFLRLGQDKLPLRSWVLIQKHYLENLTVSKISNSTFFFLLNISSPKVTKICSRLRTS
jgi:hypothetical protein